jgi:hypothetical protein
VYDSKKFKKTTEYANLTPTLHLIEPSRLFNAFCGDNSVNLKIHTIKISLIEEN